MLLLTLCSAQFINQAFLPSKARYPRARSKAQSRDAITTTPSTSSTSSSISNHPTPPSHQRCGAHPRRRPRSNLLQRHIHLPQSSSPSQLRQSARTARARHRKQQRQVLQTLPCAQSDELAEDAGAADAADASSTCDDRSRSGGERRRRSRRKKGRTLRLLLLLLDARSTRQPEVLVVRHGEIAGVGVENDIEAGGADKQMEFEIRERWQKVELGVWW